MGYPALSVDFAAKSMSSSPSATTSIIVYTHSVLGRGVLGAEQTVRRFVLLNGREAAHGRVEAVVLGIVIALADLAQQHVARTRLHLEIVVQVLLNVDGLAGGQADLGSGGDGVSPAVSMDGDIAFIVDGLVGVGIVHPDQHVSAAPVDDVLGLVPVEVVGGILSLFQEQQLLGVDLGVFFPHGLAAVADGDEGESDLIEIPLTVVRDVPAQTAVPDFVVFVTFGFPFLRGKMALY